MRSRVAFLRIERQRGRAVCDQREAVIRNCAGEPLLHGACNVDRDELVSVRRRNWNVARDGRAERGSIRLLQGELVPLAGGNFYRERSGSLNGGAGDVQDKIGFGNVGGLRAGGKRREIELNISRSLRADYDRRQ
jgi:hypothetical protein